MSLYLAGTNNAFSPIKELINNKFRAAKERKVRKEEDVETLLHQLLIDVRLESPYRVKI